MSRTLDESTLKLIQPRKSKREPVSITPEQEVIEPLQKKTRVQNTVTVVDFSSGKSTSKTSNNHNAKDFHSFMSSKISKITNIQAPPKKLNKEQENQERQDKQNDKELFNLLQSSKLIQEYTSTELFGNDRRKHIEKKMADLGGRAELSHSAKAPRNIRLGMERKQKERAEKRLQESKDMGMYSKKTKNIYTDDILKKPTRKKSSKGLVEAMGKFKNGILNLKQSEISSSKKSSFQMGSVSKRTMSTLGMKAGAGSKAGKKKSK